MDDLNPDQGFDCLIILTPRAGQSISSRFYSVNHKMAPLNIAECVASTVLQLLMTTLSVCTPWALSSWTYVCISDDEWLIDRDEAG